MKPAPFDYHAPATLAEAIALLREHGDAAKLLAGGQSLVPMLNMRLARPGVLIDLNRVAGLSDVRQEGDTLVIGAMTRHAEVERSALVARLQPLLTEAMAQVGHIQIRNRGTIGGSLVHADPSAELPAVLVALDGSVRVAGPGGEREIAAADLFLMYFTTSLQADEVLTEVRLPVLPAQTGWAFEEVARRHGDFALVGVAVTLTLDEEGGISAGRIALTGVGMTPVRAASAEARLAGRPPTPEVFAEAASAVRDEIEPDTDIHATADFRRHLAGVLTERALGRALQRALERVGSR
ncbi:MAG TPA: xanthine dehydrogenase family protein subunit M [Symbiobacteriaceae bacterium]|nr:xanthine dehydrogenase family protein subunit M [Symbiobacteriaceae bacterium]